LEPLTHFLFGGVMARAGLNRQSALATAALVLSAEAPDLDVLSRFGGRVYGFAHHRGITHTFVGLLLMAALVVLVLWLYWLGPGKWRHRPWQPRGDPRWGRLYLLALVGGLSHILLDYTNNYGVRPFAPFSYRWYSWDIVFIAEPVLWVILLGGLVLPRLFRRRRESWTNRQELPPSRLGAVIALGLVVALWGLRDREHRQALKAVQAATYRGEAVVRATASPYYVNPFRWYTVVETRDFYQTMDVDSRQAADDPPQRPEIYYKQPETPATLAAKQSRVGRVYLDWARFPMAEAESLDTSSGGYLVRLFDLRYAYPDVPGGRGLLGAWVQLDDGLHIIGENMGRPPVQPERASR
jgi:inner membrane protein